MKITVRANAKVPVDQAWSAWTSPDDIVQWNAASEDWHTTNAEIDLRVGGQFSYRMEAKDGSVGFDFNGTLTKVIANECLEYSIEDGREVSISFVASDAGVAITETFDAETQNPPELQQQGWQSILDNFVRHVESKAG